VLIVQSVLQSLFKPTSDRVIKESNEAALIAASNALGPGSDAGAFSFRTGCQTRVQKTPVAQSGELPYIAHAERT